MRLAVLPRENLKCLGGALLVTDCAKNAVYLDDGR
jgi:hypothetical protein